MIRIERNLIVRCPVEQVFDFISNLENEPKYEHAVLKIQKTSAGPVRLGTTYREVTRVLGRPIALTVQVEEYIPERRISFHGSAPDLLEIERWAMRPTMGGTRIECELDYEPRGMMKLTEPIESVIMNRNANLRLAQLKKLLESHG